MQHHQNTDRLYKGDKRIYTCVPKIIHGKYTIFDIFTTTVTQRHRQHDTEHSQTLDFRSEQTGTLLFWNEMSSIRL